MNEYSADVPEPIVIKHETAAGLTVAATSYQWGDIGVAYSQATYKYPSDLLSGYTFVQVNGTEPTGITNKVVELTYIYQLESYVLSFEANSGTLTAYSGSTSQTLDYGTSTGAALTDPVRAGYAFTGWKVTLPVASARTTWTTSTTMPQNDVTIEAQWKKNDHNYKIVDTPGTISGYS